MLNDTTSCSSASRSVRNSRVETGSFAALRCRKKSISMPAKMGAGYFFARPFAEIEPDPISSTLQQEFQMPLPRRPLALDDAEHHGVAIAAVGPDLVVAQHAVLLRAEAQDRLARGVIGPVRAELDRDAVERLECMRKKQHLAIGVGRGPLRPLCVPRVPDLETAVRRI